METAELDDPEDSSFAPLDLLDMKAIHLASLQCHAFLVALLSRMEYPSFSMCTLAVVHIQCQYCVVPYPIEERKVGQNQLPL